MTRILVRIVLTACLMFAVFAAFSNQSAAGERALWGRDAKVTASSKSVSVSGADVTIQPSDEQYPGITIEPKAPWDLSDYGYIEARILNTGATPLGISLRVDNAGDWKDNPWNVESAIISAGQSSTIKVMFGYSYGQKPGFKLDPSKVVRLLLFTNQPSETVAFQVKSIVAGGKKGEPPAVAPEDVRMKPANNLLVGPGVSLDLDKQVAADRATVSTKGSGLIIEFESKGSSVTLRPTQGSWDLRDVNRISMTYTSPLPTPSLTINSKGGAISPKPNQRSTSRDQVFVSYTYLPSYDLAVKNSAGFTSDSVTGLTITAGGAGKLIVDRIETASIEDAPPSWVGKRPPVEGSWIKTLDEEFEGNALNDKVWNVTGENYYDKVSHWSKDNVLLGKGVVRLRYEEKKGYQNDDPKRNETPYASGFLDTYGKWTQKYGYFEARMKLPLAPGLWPAFWMMPDRGAASGEQWQRQDTAKGGMEFDIMEHLTRWGGLRYNVAVHYDGYEKDHKSLGSDKIYVHPDAEGYLTCGLLWLPGEATFYCNGIEVAYWKDARISSVPSDLMFTLPSGGWDNDALDDSKLPADFVIDYVRVWQRKDLKN